MINNAGRAVELVEAEGSLAEYVWRFEPPRRPEPLDRAALAQLAHDDRIQGAGQGPEARGWRFVGPTTVYAFMQAMGLVNDHLDGCAAWPQVDAARRRFATP